MADEIPLSFESPESSSITGASYDPDTFQLEVRFREEEKARVGGRIVGTFTEKVYDVPGVPMYLWEEFLAAKSKGNFFNTQIRPLYSAKRRVEK